MLNTKLNLIQNTRLNFGNKSQDEVKNNKDQKHFAKNSLSFKGKKEEKPVKKSFFQKSYHDVKKFVNSILEKLSLKKPAIAVIFDMDGVIVDSIPNHETALLKYWNKYRPEVSDEEVKRRILGKTNRAIFSDLFQRELTDEEVQKYTKEKEIAFVKSFNGKVKEIDGFTEFVQSLGDIPKTIATSSPLVPNVKFLLNKLGLRKYFDLNKVISSSIVTKGKPDPEVYEKARSVLSEDLDQELKPENCLVFEDALFGVDAAKRAGMKVVGVATTLPAEALWERGADDVIENFNEMDLNRVNEILDDKNSTKSN